MQEKSQIVLPVITGAPSDSKAKAMLSPFTWTNLTLPVVPKPNQSVQIKSKAHINQAPLTIIKQIQTKNIINKKSDVNKESSNKQTLKNNHHQNNELTKKLTNIDRKHRYSTKSREQMNIVNKTMQLVPRQQTKGRETKNKQKIMDPLGRAIEIFQQRQKREREVKSREEIISLSKKECKHISKSRSKNKQIKNSNDKYQYSTLQTEQHPRRDFQDVKKFQNMKHLKEEGNPLNKTMNMIKQKEQKMRVTIRSREQGIHHINNIIESSRQKDYRAKSVKNKDLNQSFNKTLQFLTDNPRTKNIVLNKKEEKNYHPKDLINSHQVVRENQKKIRTISQHQPGTELSKRIRYLDQKNNMEKYLKANLTKNGWRPSSLQDDKNAQLVWSNYDRPGDYQQLKKGQFYNHINGSVNLTNKDKLHQYLNSRGCNYYPRSFLVPQQYDDFIVQNNNIAVKMMLRTISLQFLKYFQKQNLKDEIWKEMQIHLGQILQSSILRTGNETVNILVKMCLYLQELRLNEGYCSYFQHFQGYFKISIKPKANLYDLLMAQATQYLDNTTSTYLKIQYKQIDYRLIALILHYHTIFQQHEPNYNYCQQIWIIKPIASSRGAGISIVKSSSTFCRTEGNLANEFKNRKKYQNKLIQKYISNPFILTTNQQFANRKFDIRQWVLLVSDGHIPKVYRYHTGYCRFAHQHFNLSKLSLESHLTNYSLFKNQEGTIPSVLMLQELYAQCKIDLRSKYVQQSTEIIKDIIFNSKNLKYQQGCFELFGFDFLVDSFGKLYLLQINLNPGCSSERHQGLKRQSEIMGKTMIELVTQKKQSDKWIAIEGPQDLYISNNEFQKEKQVNIKPFYQTTLDQKQSLIALIRYRKRILFNLLVLTKRYLNRFILSRLKGTELQMIVQKKDGETVSQCQIRFVQQKSTSSF